MNFLSIKNNEKLNKVIETMLFIYIVIQPFLDTIYLFDERVINMFGISPSTLIRFLFIAVCALLTVISQGLTKKFWLLLGYVGITAVYFVIHCINSLNFNTFFPDIVSLSIIDEAVYICRFMIPAVIIYVASSLKFTNNFFEKAIVALSTTISGMIIVTNLLGISLDSYTNKRISHNIFYWFTDTYTQDSFNGLASKAFFNFANMVSVICCMLLPIIIYLAIEKNPLYFILVFFHSVAMLMLGTKTSTFGVALILIAYMAIYLFLLFVKQCDFAPKKPLIINIFSVLIISAIIIGIILPVSPAIYRNRISMNYMQNFESSEQSSTESDSESDSSADDSSDTTSDPENDSDTSSDPENPSKEDADSSAPITETALRKKLNSSGIISRFYLQSYPYTYDLEFWEGICALDSTKRLDSRFIEESMLKRIKEINNNPLDDWLGITYSRTSRVYNLERDTVYQYYSLGIIGIILFIFPFIALLVYGVLKCLIHFKNMCNLRNISFLFSIAITIITGIYCGNTIDNLFANILLSFVCAATLIVLQNNKDINKN